MRHVKHIHFVGIGGIGMGGIAQVLLNEGYHITGSDLSENTMTAQLKNQGVMVFKDHHADYIKGADVVVFSTAIDLAQNPELMEARRAHIPVIPRAQMLAELMRFRHGIAVTGTHGKTTTTSLIANLLAQGGLDPTFVIGGQLNHLGQSAQLGASQYLVAEADESDASFLHLQPMMTVVTNIDADHLACYDGKIAQLHQTFLTFIHHLPFYGLAVLCIDDPVIQQLLPEISRPHITYGFSEQADVQMMDYQQVGLISHFKIKQAQGKPPLAIELRLPGRHNALNATAAMVVAQACDVSDQAIQQALADFSGVARRFQVHEGCTIDQATDITVIDDYGHHPEEISVTLNTITDIWPDRRVVLLFQPHRFSRTQDLFEDFVHVLKKPDALILLDIYPASEAPLEGITSQALADAIGNTKPVTVTQLAKVSEVLPQQLKTGDILLIQGAGSIGHLVETLIGSC